MIMMKQIYIKKMAKRTLRVLPVIFLSMGCLLMIVFGCLGALGESGRVKVGLVMPREDTLTMAFLNTIQNMGEISSLCDFSMTTEEEGREQLEQGEISALLVLPENVLQKIYRNDKTTIHMYMPDKPTMESALIREFAEAGTSLVLTAKAGDYTAYNLYQRYGKSGTMQKVAADMNGSYIQFVMRQETLFSDNPVTAIDGMTDEERYLAAGIVLVLFLLGIPVVQMRKKEPAILLMQLERAGIRPLFSLVAEMLMLTLALFVVTLTGAGMMVYFLDWDISFGFLTLGLLAGSLCATSFFLILCASDQGTAGCILLIFITSLLQVFLSGGIFPIYVLPKLCVRLGELLPGGMLMKCLHRAMFEGEWHLAGWFVMGYAVIFFLGTLWLKLRRGRYGV